MEVGAATGWIRTQGRGKFELKSSLSGLFALVVALAMAIAATAPMSAFAADPVVAAAGDISCDPTDGNFNGGLGTSNHCRQLATSDLLVNGNYTAVLPLGDNQYGCGGAGAYLQSYDLSWGRVKSITHPVPGNHEYSTSGGTGCSTNADAAGYFGYFGAAAGATNRGYYSYNLDSWHVIALNSNCGRVGGCGAGSPQEQWLRNDLAASHAACTLAYWHHPLFTSGEYAPGVGSVRPLFQALYDNKVDIVLNGHDHNYERFAPQAPSGVLDRSNGIREFIVGTGGKSLYSPQTPIANSEVRSTSAFGVLVLKLHWQAYEWEFIPAAGGTFHDAGGEFCENPGQTYARPRAASPTSIAMVPAFEPCATANATHGAPLASPSCNPPRLASQYLTVGTPDTNGNGANFTGRLELATVGESPINMGNGDQADVRIKANFTDVRRAASPYADYTGQLQGQLMLRMTDRTNGSGLTTSATTTDVPVSFTIPCQATASTTVGSTCAVATSVDSVMPGAVKEGKRSVWEIRDAKVFDGGPDGVASTAGNTLFATQGFFAP
jgi:calcineurin-like phosphoesterase family protein